MPKNVSVDGLGDFEFPDEATDGQIKVYLRKQAGLTPHGTKPTKPQDAPGFDAAQPGIASDTISGMGRMVAPSMAAEDRKVNRGTLPAVGKGAGAALEMAGEGLSLGMDASGMGKPQQRVGQAIDLFAQQGKTPLENLKYAGGKLVGAAKKTYRDMSNPDGTGASTVMAGGPPAIAAKFTGNLLDSVDDGRRPDPTGESFVQKRQRYVDAARRVADAKSKGLPVDPADRDLYAQAKAGLLPTAEADPMTGLIAEPMPDRPGGMAESAVRAIAKTPAAIAETFTAPENVAIMGGTKGAMGLASRFLPPPAALATQMAIGAGTTGYFLNDMSKGAGESIGRVAGGDFDQRFIEEEGPNALANAAFVGHMGATSAKPIAQSVEGIRANSLSVKTEALHNQSLQTAVEKVAANRADGKSIFAGLNKNEVAAYTRTQEAIAKANEAQGNEVQTEPLARDNSVDDAVQIVKQMYGDRPDLKVSIAETAADLPAGLLPVNDTAGTVKAVFNPNTNEVHVVRDRVTSAAELAQKLAHERDHGTTDIPAHQVAGFAEKSTKAELAKLVQEGRLDPAEFERLVKLTGEAFSGEVKRIASDRNHPAQIAADEVMAGMAEQMPAQPGRFAQGMATLASKIPGIQLTEMDARALAAKQAAAKAQPFQPDRPVEMLGEAPQLPPVDRRPAPPVEAAPVAEAPVAPKESFVGREVTVGGKKAKIIADDGSGKFVIQPEKGEPRIWTPNKTSHPSVPQKGERVALPDGTEGVIYSTDKTSAAVRFDDGTSKIVKREGLRRVEQPVAPEVPVAQPVQQVAPVQLAEAPEHRANIATRKAIDEMTPDEARYAVEALRQERHTDEQTGLKNYKAWLEDPIDAETPVKVITDADNFKAYNTNFGHAGGDVVIKDALAEGFRRAGLGDNAYRISRSGGGDEFAFKFKTREEAVAKMEHAREVVRGMRITLEKDGVTRVHEGVEFSHGIGERLDLKDADADLVRNKEQRAADGVRATGRDALPPGFREVRDDLGSTGGRVEGEVGGVPGPDATGPVDPAAASQSPALYSRAPSKHDQLVRPIMGDLVEVASQLMADKANKIRTPEDLVRAMTDRMNGRLAKEVEIESKAIFDEAVKPPADRANLPSVQKALDEKLLPAKELGVSEDQRTREVQLAVDRAREDAGVVTKRADETTQAAGIKLLSNVGTEGVELMVLDRAKSPGGTLNDTETVAAKLALQDADRNKAMMSDPVLFAQRKAFANAFRITGTEQGRALRQRRWDITSPTHERVKAALYEILMNSGDKKPLPNAASKAAVELKKIRDFLTKEAGVKDVESIPIEMLTDEAAMTSLVREWSSKQASVSMKMRTWYLNSLVSAFKTHTANMVGNGVNFAFEYGVHRRLEARINQLFGVDGILPSDLKGMSAQFLKAQSAAMRDTAHYLKTGKNNLEQRVHGAEWYDQLRQQKRSFSGKAGTIIEASTRFLGTEDAYAVSLIGHMEAYATARMLARKEMSGKVGTPEYNARVDELVNDYGSKAWSRAMDRAEYLTFKDESGKLIKSLLAFRRAHPNVSYILPFITTPANLLARGTEFVPGVGLMFRGILADRAAVKSGELAPPGEMTLTERYSRLAAAQLIGLGATIAVAASGASMFKDDNDEPFITGSEPPRKFDRGEQEARRRSLPAYTFRNPLDPTERISYRRIDPISTAVGLTVDMVDMWRDAEKNKDFGRILDKGKNAVIGQLVGKTFLKGPSDWIEWVQDEPGAKFPLFDVATGFYPNALRQIPAALDPYVREQKQYGADSKQTGQGQAERFAKTMAFKATGMPYIPGIGTLVEPKVNVYGDEVRKTGSPLYRGFIPFDRSGEEQISPEGRQADLRYIRTINDLPADTPSLPMESGPRVSFAGQNIQMTPRDWHDYETEKGSFLKSNIGDVTNPDNRQKKLEPWQIEMMRSLASAGGSVAASKVAPKYLK